MKTDKDRIYLKCMREYWALVYAKYNLMKVTYPSPTPEDLIRYKEITRQEKQVGKKLQKIGRFDWLLEADKPQQTISDVIEHLKNIPKYYFMKKEFAKECLIEVSGDEYKVKKPIVQFIEYINVEYGNEPFDIIYVLGELQNNEEYKYLNFPDSYKDMNSIFNNKSYKPLQTALFTAIGKGRYQSKIDIVFE